MSTSKIVLGFIPLVDCASLVAAAERGFAAEENIDLTLICETSWANIRDRLVIGHFHAAHMLGPMPIAATLGIGHVAAPIIAPLALGLGGNAITVSLPLWEQMLHQGAAAGADPRTQGAALRNIVAARARAAQPPLTFGMVYPFSCHNYQLRYWLAATGIDPDRDVRLVVLPPPFLADALRAGQIDGFCVGEPWNSVAVEARVGAIVLPTTAIWRRSPEKVLGCRADWAEQHPQLLAALIRALYRAAHWCEQAANHAELAAILSQPRYVGAPTELLHCALANRLTLTPGAAPTALEDFFVPARHAATFPWTSHALWHYTQMVRWRQIRYSADHALAVRHTYRPDLYRAALTSFESALPRTDSRIEEASVGGFFDERSFDPSRLPAYLAGD